MLIIFIFYLLTILQNKQLKMVLIIGIIYLYLLMNSIMIANEISI